MNLFYDADIEKDDCDFLLNETESHHALRVMRMKTGEKLWVVNGKGFLFETIILESQAKKCRLQIQKVDFENPSKKEVHIAVAPTKNMDRNEWFAEKATEIGITEISWILCDNSERKVLKTDRIGKVVLAAMKQSNRLYLPKVNEMISLKEFIQTHSNGVVAHCYEDEPKKELKDFFQSQNFPILIGPEGDFSRKEVSMLKESGYNGISLGNNRLRTETAALVACMQCVFYE